MKRGAGLEACSCAFTSFHYSPVQKAVTLIPLVDIVIPYGQQKKRTASGRLFQESSVASPQVTLPNAFVASVELTVE